MSNPNNGLPTNTSQASALHRPVRGMRLELLAVLAVTVLPLLVSSVHSALARETPQFLRAELGAAVLFNALHWLVGLLLVAYVVYQRGDSLQHFGWRIRPAVIPGSFAVFALAILAYGVVYLVVDSAGLVNLEWPERSRDEAIPQGAGALLLLMAVGSPVFEETVVRAYLMTRLRDLGFGPAWCVLGSTLVQTSYHLHKGFDLVPSYAAIFLVLSLCFARYRNLPVVILAHLYIDIVWWSSK